MTLAEAVHRPVLSAPPVPLYLKGSATMTRFNAGWERGVKNWIIAALVGVIAIGGALGAFAATETVETTETVEVRFWQGVTNNSVLWYKARPEGGDWTPITRLRMPDFDLSGNYHQGDISIDVPISVTVEVADPPPVETEGASAATQTVETTETVEVRFWQGVTNNSVLWYKARPEGGDWTAITRLRMPDFDLSGNYHQGDISIDVPITVTVEVPDPLPVETEPEPAADCVQRDRDALVAFYNSLGGPNWRSSTGWLSERPLDMWRGSEDERWRLRHPYRTWRERLERDYPVRGRRSLQPHGPGPEREQRHYRGAPT